MIQNAGGVGVGMPQFARLLFSPEQDTTGTDIENLIAGSDGASQQSQQSSGNGAAGGGDQSQGGAGALSGEVEIPKVGKVKLADLAAAYGRQKQYQQETARYKQYADVIAILERDPRIKNAFLSEFNGDDQASPQRGGDDADGRTEEPDKSLLDKNPVEYFKQLRAFDKQEGDRKYQELAMKFHDRELAREENELRTKYKVSDQELRAVQAAALRYRDANGDPLPLEDVLHVVRSPRLAKEHAELQAQLNARASGIPGGRIQNRTLSRKQISEMTDVEREAAMLDEFYAHQNGAK